MQRLKVPTHPEFDLDRDSGTLTYVPPVKLNNLLVVYVNAMLEVGEDMVQLIRNVEGLKVQRKRAEQDHARVVRELFTAAPIPANATKNLPLTEAYARTLAQEAGRLGELDQLRADMEGYELDIQHDQAEIEAAKRMLELLQMASDNIKTHLSYVKSEQRYT